MAELHDLTALEQAAALRRGEFSSVELVSHYLDRIDRHGAALGAFVTVTGEAALAAAADVRQATASSRADPAAQSGPMAGVPVAIKDLNLTAGVRTTFGSAAFADFVPAIDSDVVAFLRAAGLISLGKTTTSEFGLSLYSETEVAPPARNPWALDCTAGGSSGGAAAAVAAGLVPFAQGNDGGGSLRIPASICGLVGYKPSRGVVSGGPLGFGGFGLPTNGPIARTVADAAAMLDILAQPAPGEPYLTPPRPAAGYLDAARHPERYLPTDRPLRIGRYVAPMLADVVPEPDVVAACDGVARQLEAMGAEISEVDPPFTPDAEPQFQILWQALTLFPVPPDGENLLLPLSRWLRAAGKALSAERLINALADLQLRVRWHAAAVAGYDLLLSPVLTRAQAPIGWFSSAADPAEDFARQERFSPYCAAYNLTGHPAVSLPLGQSADGAPIGVMLAAPPGADALLIAVSARLEAAAAWADRHPPVWWSGTDR
jgi:amidase